MSVASLGGAPSRSARTLSTKNASPFGKVTDSASYMAEPIGSSRSHQRRVVAPRPKRRSRGVMLRSRGVALLAMLYLRHYEWTLLTLMSIARERLTPEESRAAALEAARALLLESGPQAVTLKAVAARIGKTHANLLHHFGSAAGLQSQLYRSIAEHVPAAIRVGGEGARHGGAEAGERARRGEADPREIVDRTFEAFDREGAGALAAWMILSGNRDALDPVLEAIHGLVNRLREGHEDRPVPELTLWLVLAALGDSLLGEPMARALGLPPEKARELATRQLIAASGLAEPGPRS